MVKTSDRVSESQAGKWDSAMADLWESKSGKQKVREWGFQL